MKGETTTDPGCILVLPSPLIRAFVLGKWTSVAHLLTV